MAESWAGGLNKGLVKGLQIGSMFEEGKARKGASKASTRMEERKKYMDQLKISTSFFNNKAVPDQAKLDEYHGSYSDAIKKLTGKEPPSLPSWGPDIAEYTKRVEAIAENTTLSRPQKFTAFASLEAEFYNDPRLLGISSVSREGEKEKEKLAHEKNKRLATQLIVEFKHNKAGVEPGSDEAKALAKDFYTKLKEIDPRAVGAATEELNIVLSREGEEATTIPYERKTPMPVTGEQVTDKGYTVGFRDDIGRAVFEPKTGKWVPYDAKYGNVRDIVTKVDQLGRVIMVDQSTGTILPTKRITTSTPDMTGENLLANISRERKPFITGEQVKTGSGMLSNIRQGFNNVFGMFVPGQIAPKTAEAKNIIKSFNQMVKEGFTINPKNPIAELKTIEGFLLDEERIFVDPDENIMKLINMVERLENVVISGQEVINSGRLSAKDMVATTDNVNHALRVLSQIPTIPQIKMEGGMGIDVGDVDRMSIDEIRNFPKENISNEVAKAMLKKMGAP